MFFTGGSSRVPAVQQAIARAAPTALATTGSDMLSVALGLTREAGRRLRLTALPLGILRRLHRRGMLD